MMYAFSPSATPQDLSAVAIALVFGAAPAREPTTIMEDAAAADWMAVAIASRLSFLFILMDQSPGLGPKTTPPPGLSGVRLEPARALPVPFCLKGLRPPPRTSLLVSVDAVLPARVLAHHDDVLVHEALGGVGLGHLDVERGGARGGAVEANLGHLRGERVHAEGGASDCVERRRGRGGEGRASGPLDWIKASGGEVDKGEKLAGEIPDGTRERDAGFARTVHHTRVMRDVQSMDATERAARRSSTSRPRSRRGRHRVKTRRGKKPKPSAIPCPRCARRRAMRGRCGTRTTLALRGELQLRTTDGGASGHVESDGGHGFCRHRTNGRARAPEAERFIAVS